MVSTLVSHGDAADCLQSGHHHQAALLDRRAYCLVRLWQGATGQSWAGSRQAAASFAALAPGDSYSSHHESDRLRDGGAARGQRGSPKHVVSAGCRHSMT